MNIATIGAYVQKAVATASKMGLAGSVTITRSASASYNATTDTPSAPVVTTFTCNGVVETVTPDEPHTGGLAPQTSNRWMLAASDCAFAPIASDRMTVNGAVQRILSVDPVAPNGVTAVAYVIEVAL